MKDRFFWPTTRRRRWLLALILLIGTAIRLWLWWRSPLHQAANDEVEYVIVARDLLAGRGWQFYATYHWLRAPLYPLWLAGSVWLFDDLKLASLPNIALSSATIYLFYLLGREIGWRKNVADPRAIAAAETVGLLSAGAAALLLTLATFASLWMSETLFTALFICALLALLRCVVRPRIWLAAGAGIFLGLAILTRSLPLPLVPLAALWLIANVAWNRRMEQTTRRAWRAGLWYGVAFGLSCVLTIAPWTIRNYLAYGAMIAVETGLSYNLWAFNEPREDPDTIFKTLEAISNPAERADYATSKGLARLREDPAILLRKLWPNWNALWMIKPIEDRFLQPTYYQDVPLNMFVTALLLDDALYVGLAVLGLWGLLYAPTDRRKLLLGAWLAYVVVVVLLTHGEGRYRHFIFPVLLPYAARQIVMLRRDSVRRGLNVRSGVVLLAVVAALWWAIVVNYPEAWAMRNLRRGWAVQRAEWALKAGDSAAALRHYQQAQAADPGSADVSLAIGRVHQRLGQSEQALAAYDHAFAQIPSYVTVNLVRGDALRQLGRFAEARRAFEGFYNDEQQMLDWGWAQLAAPPPAAIEVGDGLDFGFVGGMYPAEVQSQRQVRWTQAHAAIKVAGSAAGGRISLTLAAPRPAGEPVPVRVCVNAACQDLMLDAEWRTYQVIAAAAPQYDVTISASTFSPRRFDLQSPDERQLGVLVDNVAVAAFAP